MSSVCRSQDLEPMTSRVRVLSMDGPHVLGSTVARVG